MSHKKFEKNKSTRVTVRYDIGFSNRLFIRGKGAGLSWDRGVLLTNAGPDEWFWETHHLFDTCEFKILINDTHYETGPNRTLHYASSIECNPSF